MTPQPGTAGTDDDPLDSIATDQLVVNGEVIDALVGLAFDSADQTDGVLRFDGTGSTSGITDGSAKVIVNGTVYDVAGGEWVDFSGTRHTVDSWEKVVNSQFDVTITSTNGRVRPGNTLDVTVDVTNSGTDQDTQTVTLDIDNGVGQVDSTSVTLSGGGAVIKTLSWSVPSGQAEQDYTATVSSADDTASQTVTVESIPDTGNLQNHWVASSFSGLNDGATITTAWTDSQGGANATHNGSPVYRESDINGRPAIEFNGSDAWFDTGLNENTDNERTIYIVGRINTSSYFYGSSGNTNNFIGADIASGSVTPTHYLGYGSGFDAPTGFPLSEYSINAITARNGSLYWHGNGTEKINVSYSGEGTVGQSSAIGIRYRQDGTKSEYLDGSIAEILRYTTGHSDTTRQAVESYLNDKYAVF